MPLPIAVGGVSLSSERIKGPYLPKTEESSSRVTTQSAEQKSHQNITWAICPRNEWQARTIVSFYDEDDENSRNIPLQSEQYKYKRRRMAEIRIQISPMINALSSKTSREMVHHMELFTYDDDDDNVGDSGDDSCSSSGEYDSESFSSESESDDNDMYRNPQTVFSQDRKHLMVLIFYNNNSHIDHPNHRQSNQPPHVREQSATIVFQLRKPQAKTANFRSSIPLPSYIVRSAPDNNGDHSIHSNNNQITTALSSTEGSPAVATNPKFVSSCNRVTAICRINRDSKITDASRRNPASSSSFFLVAKSDGTLNWVNAKDAQISATAVLPTADPNQTFVESMVASPSSTRYSGVAALVMASSNTSLGLDGSQSSDSYLTDDDVQDFFGTTSSIDDTGSSGSTNETCRSWSKGGDCVLVEWSCAPSANNSLQHERSRESGKNKNKAVDATSEEVDCPRKLDQMDHPTSQELPKKNGATFRSSSVGNKMETNNYSFGTMQLQLRAVWSPPSSSDTHKEAKIVRACFGSMSSVLCVVYRYTNRERYLGPLVKMAQVLTLPAKSSRESSVGHELIPTVSMHLSPEQVEQAPSVSNINRDTDCYDSNDESYCESESSVDESLSDEESRRRGEVNSFGIILESRLVGIQHDPNSDSFVISSIFVGNRDKKNCWVGCAWNWRANAIGWMIKQELETLPSSISNDITNSCGNDLLWSRLYLCRDPYNRGRSHLVHIESSFNKSDVYVDENISSAGCCDLLVLENRKSTVPVAILSPASSSNPDVFTERSSLLLAEKHVSFPSVKFNDSDKNVQELDWKISALPFSYIATQGSPRIATIGPVQIKSIAVASSRGVCILDTYHNRWKQFGSPDEERSFSIVSMTWWEGSPEGGEDDKRDDLLVAIVQTSSGRQFLSCWSSKRLDLLHQLMDTPDLEWQPGESQDPDPTWGIPLPTDMTATNISLLSEPEEEQSGGRKIPRRAVALVYSADLETMKYKCLVFQLQVTRNKVSSSRSSEPYVVRRPFYVMALNVFNTCMNEKYCPGPVTSAFIASANFQFDLRQSSRRKSKLEIEEKHCIATLGVARSPGGIHAVSLFKNGETSVASLSKHEISKYHLSDQIMHSVLSNGICAPATRLVWTIELLNGNVICWSVPLINKSQTSTVDKLDVHSPSPEEIPIYFSDPKRPKGLQRPYPICNANSPDKDKNECGLLGTIFEIGNVSDWAMQSTFGSQLDISLGYMPKSVFGCVLRCGQTSQNISRGQIGGIDDKIFSSNVLEVNSFSQSPFIITPPAFLTSLYTLLMEETYIKMDSQVIKSSLKLDGMKNRLEIIQRQVQYRLRSVRNTDSLMMALRLIISRSLEMIAKTHKSHLKRNSERSKFNLLLSKNMLSTIIGTIRRCTSNLQFASLFFEVGRQTEPGNLDFLFPLPNTLNETELDLSIAEARSVIDLFTICIDEGSLAASSSALPLLTSKAQARYYCELLLDEAIENFLHNSSLDRCRFDSTEEERLVLGDSFRFGMKLEDAERYDEDLVANGRGGGIGPDDTSIISIDRSTSSDQNFFPQTPEKSKRALICSPSATNGSIFGYFVPSVIRRESDKQRIEDAIRREASSFIKKSLDDPVSDFSMLPDWDDSLKSPNTNRADVNSVAYLVGNALLQLLQDEKSNNNWKIIAAFAKLIIQEGVEIPSSYTLLVEIAKSTHPLDVISIIPESYKSGNGNEENMSTFIETAMKSCGRQISCADAVHVVNMSLLLIDRLESFPLADTADQREMELGLVIIIMVVGYVGGQSQFIQDMIEDDSLLDKCYKQATSAMI